MQSSATSPALDPKLALFGALAFVGAWFLVAAWRVMKARRAEGSPIAPTPAQLAVGFGTNFFDTLGIGSFATTTAAFRQWRLIPDELLPGTLNLGHTLPVIVQAVIYTRIVPVDPTTLVLMIAAAVVGSYLGAGAVSGWSRRGIQLGMGSALVAAALLMLLSQLNLLPGGGALLRVSGSRLVIAMVGNFVLGALMTVGIGLYAPCLILVSLLGMNPTAAFPIMMGSCAFLMPIGAIRFAHAGKVDWRASLGLSLGGLPAVLIAASIVGSLPLTAVRWLVIAVVTYTAATMLRSALATSATAPPLGAEGGTH
jgi:uncharacterized membrane protein YfcA